MFPTQVNFSHLNCFFSPELLQPGGFAQACHVGAEGGACAHIIVTAPGLVFICFHLQSSVLTQLLWPQEEQPCSPPKRWKQGKEQRPADAFSQLVETTLEQIDWQIFTNWNKVGVIFPWPNEWYKWNPTPQMARRELIWIPQPWGVEVQVRQGIPHEKVASLWNALLCWNALHLFFHAHWAPQCGGGSQSHWRKREILFLLAC